VRARPLLIAVVMFAMAAVCVRMGLWQAERWRVRLDDVARRRAALAAPPLEWRGGPAPTGRRLLVRGGWDEARQVLVSDRWRDDSAGVEVATPLLAKPGAVIVDRGWLPSMDAIHADPFALAEPGERVVIGIAEPFPAGAAPWESLPAPPGTRLWSARRLDRASLEARLPYALAPFVLRALPGDSAPAWPVRERPALPDPVMHLSYAVQWTLFALGFAGGAVLVLVRERRRGAPAATA
jgi:surfeit locus 1 family protein